MDQRRHTYLNCTLDVMLICIHVGRFQVSETENIRKNLAIERMIVEGCDILLDVNQMFVRQGTLVHILPAGHKSSKNRISLGCNYFTLVVPWDAAFTFLI